MMDQWQFLKSEACTYQLGVAPTSPYNYHGLVSSEAHATSHTSKRSEIYNPEAIVTNLSDSDGVGDLLTQGYLPSPLFPFRYPFSYYFSSRKTFSPDPNQVCRPVPSGCWVRDRLDATRWLEEAAGGQSQPRLKRGG